MKHTPKETHHTVETFIEAFKNELKIEHIKKKFPKNNLTKNEIEALKELSIRDDIIITKTDKGRVAVIIDVQHYINAANRQRNSKSPNRIEEKKSQQCNQGTKICKITRRKDSDKAGSLKSKNTGVLYVSKNTKTRKPRTMMISSVNCHMALYISIRRSPSTTSSQKIKVLR